MKRIDFFFGERRTALIVCFFALIGLAFSACCEGAVSKSAPPAKTPLAVFEQPVEPPDPEPSTDSPKILLKGATIMTAEPGSKPFGPGYLLINKGMIEEVGQGDGPDSGDAITIDASGMYITPGIIDPHSHLGVLSLPHAKGLSDGNESTNPVTPQCWAEHAFWPNDPGIHLAVTGGVTSIQILPGSGNLIGGRSFVVKLKPRTSARLMRFPGAPQGLKMACGENPKSTFGEKGGPKTRMGSVAGMRAAFQKALEYRRSQEAYRRDLDYYEKTGKKSDDGKPIDPPAPPARDFGMETLVKVLNGEILVQDHCYRSDELSVMLDLAKEFGFKIRAFHHATEAYKIADRLAAEETGAAVFSDWWGYKMEAFDHVPQSAAILTAAGARAMLHSDSATEMRHLNQEAAKAMAAGREIGIDVDETEALRWITANPAWSLGVDDKVGTLTKGKMADVVVWNGNPFSVYTKAQMVFIDGYLEFDRNAPQEEKRSDFETGMFDGSDLKGGGK